MYTGALENHPDFVDRLAGERTLFGNRGDGLRRVRRPELLAEVLDQAGLASPPVAASPTGLPADGTWLRKLRDSAGGGHVRVWRAERTLAADGRYYYQQRVAGLPCAALYVAAGGGACLLGVTEQLIGAEWAGGWGFRYCGSLGPLPLPEPVRDQFQRIGDCLAGEFALAGLFGVDAVLDGDTVWCIEVNPRYPASAEVLERALGLSAVGLHVAACRDGTLPAVPQAHGSRWSGKAILYARTDGEATVRLLDLRREFPREPAAPALADIPPPGTKLRRGRPVLTVLADGVERQAVFATLQNIAGNVEVLLASGPADGA